MSLETPSDGSPTVIAPTGFREYDARWRYPQDIDLAGVRALGLGFGTLVCQKRNDVRVVTGHDYRSYSASVHAALIEGLVAAGCRVHDIGLCITPTAYYAQFALDIEAVAMVTASHNPNGWTGVKMGLDRPFTLGPDEMNELKAIVLGKVARTQAGGEVSVHGGMNERYIADLMARPPIARRLKAVVACGNGTAGLFAPRVLSAVGCDVVPLDCELDHDFPNCDPNPEDLKMLRRVEEAVLASKADVGFAFDGDGDRCGIVDDEGKAIFADKVGLLLARSISRHRPGTRFVVDVKATSLFSTDPVLRAQGAATDYWKTGHSYIKRRTAEIDAAAGFEKSGHFFFREPLGRGYDDGLVSALAVCALLDEAGGKSLAGLYRELPVTWSSPTMSPHCGDEVKYEVVERVKATIRRLQAQGTLLAGHRIASILEINGVRVTLEDGSWFLVRASSNKPELTVVCESGVSKNRMEEVFAVVDAMLSEFPEVGEFNQRIQLH